MEATTAEPEHIATVRSFNRSFTQRIGVLHDRFLGRDRPLGAARVLFEIGPDGVGVAELRRRLGLDSGYLSRLLRRLEDEGLIEVTGDPADRRRRHAFLRDPGRHEWRELDRRSDELAAALIAPLSVAQRDRLAEALRTADRILRAATVRLEVVDPSSPAAIASMTRYFDELDDRFESGFDPGETLVADAPSLRAPSGVFVVAFDDATAVACGGVQTLDDGTAEIKRMWVDPDRRGLGLGRRMLDHLEDWARDHRHRRVRLDTNSVLIEAITMYETAGYVEIAAYNDNPFARHWFEKRLDSDGRS